MGWGAESHVCVPPARESSRHLGGLVFGSQVGEEPREEGEFGEAQADAGKCILEGGVEEAGEGGGVRYKLQFPSC